MEITPFFVGLLLITGVIAGVINTLAGGGSNLTLPALMLMGLPADVANATNRVGVLLQNLVGVKAFDKHGQLPKDDLPGILIPTLLGGAVGALAASFMPLFYLKPVLLLSMVAMSVLILLRPSAVMPAADELPKVVKSNRLAFISLFLAGVYGGFVQAGVGFILIAALAGTLRYDLVKTNALKMLCTGAFTLLALAVFVVRDQVLWLPGLILAAGTMVGAGIGVNLALSLSQTSLKWFLFVMTLCASVAAIIF